MIVMKACRISLLWSPRFLLTAFAIFPAMLLVTTGCAPWELGAEKNVVRNGIEFETFRENDDGSRMGTLAKDTVVDGWPCKKGFIGFYADWRLDECHLSREYERNGIVMPALTRVFPDKSGNPGVCLFPADTTIQGYRCRGTRSGGFMTAFHANGRLHWFYARDPVVVNGVTCKSTLFQAVYLHPDGGLQECKLAKPVSIDGVSYPKGRIIRMDRAGAVMQ